ncbi:MAG: hypothetical protein H0Z33_11155 [Bacillaceae bacterium]|nr:hypothetical protein [Bacillaceae bacterium]
MNKHEKEPNNRSQNGMIVDQGFAFWFTGEDDVYDEKYGHLLHSNNEKDGNNL